MGRPSAEGAIEQANCSSICVYFLCVCVCVSVCHSASLTTATAASFVCVCVFFLASTCVTVAKVSRETADECVSLCVYVCGCLCDCVCVCLCIELLLSSGFNVRVWDLLYDERIARVDKQMRTA